MRRDRRFIIIKINSHNIAYGVIDGSSISFYGNNGEVVKTIDLSMMLEEIIDIPAYFKLLFEKGMDAVGCTAETESMDLSEYCQNMMPYMQFPPTVTRTAGPEVVRTFDLDDQGMFLTIQIVPQVQGLYYDFTIYNYNRLIMDIIATPIDMLYVDADNGYVHTMERGHTIRPFNPTEILTFLHPELEIMEKSSKERVFFV